MIVGFDISTSIVGITFLDDSARFLEAHAIILPNSTLPERALFLETKLHKIFEENSKTFNYDVKEIWIEEPFQMFAKGGSSAATMMRLASFNGMCQFMLHRMTDVVPGLVNANAARKLVGLKIQREKTCGISTKEQVLTWAKSRLLIECPLFPWPKKTLKSGPRKNLTIDCPSCYDIADSLVVANAGFIKSRSIR